MQWVFDSSVALAWCFEDERTAATEALLDRLATVPAIVPQIWPLEMANVLTLATRRRRITPDLSSQFICLLRILPVRIDLVSVDDTLDRIIALADANGLTAYDASYLKLAKRLSIPLATLDHSLGDAARRNGVVLL